MPRAVDRLVLPAFELLKKQPDAPHVSRTVETCTLANGTVVKVEENRKGTKWWVSASLDGYRMSNTISTGVKAKADAWRRAVKACRVEILDRDDL